MLPAPDEIEEIEKKYGMTIKRILRGDVPTFMEVPLATKREHLKDVDVAVLGIPWEGFIYDDVSGDVFFPPMWSQTSPGSTYSLPKCRGADKAPEAIRKASTYYSIRDAGGTFPELDWNLRLADQIKIVDYGDVDIVPGDAEETFKRAEEKVSHVLKAGAVPVVLGGDHAITYPPLKAVAQHTKGKIGIIDFDCHIDLDESLKYDAAWQFLGAFQLENVSPKNMVQIGISDLSNLPRWFENAKKLGVKSFTITDVEENGISAIVKEAMEIATNGTEAVYVTLDVDVIDPAFCPAQKYPDPAGLTAREIMTALRIIGTGRIAGFDMCCLSPLYDTPSGTGSQLAARCAVMVIGTIALKKMRS